MDSSDSEDLSDSIDDTEVLIRQSSNQLRYPDSTSHRPTKGKLYKRRWLILIIFCLNSMMNAVLWISLGSINDITANYYSVDPAVIDWMANSFTFAYVFAALPCAYMMTSWGVRPTMIIGSSFNAIATALHFAGCSRKSFAFVIVGQLFAAIASATILQVPGRLSAVWFGANERAVATSLGVSMNTFGVAVGFLQPTHMVPQTDDMEEVEEGIKLLNLSQLCICMFLLIMVYLFYEEEPPTPPTVSGAIAPEESAPSFFQSLKMLAIDTQFNILSQCYALYFGMYCVFSVLLNELVVTKFPQGYESYIGWMGFGCDAVAIISMFVFGLILDKFQCFRTVAICLNLFSLFLMLAFLTILTQMRNFTLLFVDYVLLGAFGIPFFATGIEQAAEMTYPVPEGTSSAVILIMGNLYGFVMVLFLGALIEKGRVIVAGGLMVGFYVLSTVLSVFVRTNLKRSDTEKARAGDRLKQPPPIDQSLPAIAGSYAAAVRN